MARKKVIYIVSYDDNRFDLVGRRHRVAAFDSFWKAHNAMSEDIDYWYSKGGYIQDEWYNAQNINNATAARIRMVLPDGDVINICITPSAIN